MIKAFRLLGYLEAISFLLLVGIAMPLKYIYGNPEAVRVLGMGHGMLFMVYILAAVYAGDALDWPKRRFLLAFVAAVMPAGTIMFDHKYLRATREGGAATR